ncbi:hypothetical protein [Streptomyces jumonjinensis]|uniref:Uncharacterized protein n=1 Tax=Streptomyces jumonjinensis TaxID=1945 RepID=A0A646KU70_STRJU|nr:hypothetical protein [Streptomyces jumonjinensis]MQT05577.1 hypothetical protein [Streptomyces jumonjinensis]
MTGPGAEPVSGPDTERRLSEAMAALAEQVHPAPGAYRTARGEWRRRERRRRLVLALLAAVVLALAVIAGLWLPDSAPDGSGPVFDGDRDPAPTAPAARPGG